MAWAPRLGRKAVQFRSKGVRYGGGGYATRGVAGEDKLREMALERVVWSMRSVVTIAANQARLPVTVREGDRHTGPVLEDHWLAGLLNGRPNVAEDAWQFRFRLSAVTLLSSAGAHVEVIRDQAGQPVSLHLLAPGSCKPVPDPETYVAGWVVDLGEGRTERLDADDVLWFGIPHPWKPYACLTPLAAAGVAMETDWLARGFARGYLQNDGRPGGILGVLGELNPDDRDEIEARFNNPSAAGRIHVMEMDDMEWVDLGVSPQSSQHVEVRHEARDEVLAAFGVPLSVLGLAAGRTFDNAAQEKLNFWDETMLGTHLPVIAGPFDKLDDDPTLLTAFDTSGVPVLQAQARERAKHLLSEFQAGAITLDQYLEATQRDAVGGPLGTARYMPMSQVPLVAGGDPDQLAKALAVVQALEARGAGGAPFRAGALGAASWVSD